MKRLFFCLMAMMGMLTLSAQCIYDFKVKDDATIQSMTLEPQLEMSYINSMPKQNN